MKTRVNLKRALSVLPALLLILCLCVGRADAASRTSTYEVFDASFTWTGFFINGNQCSIAGQYSSGVTDGVATLVPSSTESFTPVTLSLRHGAWNPQCHVFLNNVDLGYNQSLSCGTPVTTAVLDISDLYEPGQAHQIKIANSGGGSGAEILAKGITYYARVQAEDGSDTGINKVVDFTVDTTPPPAPTLVDPPAGVTITTTKPKFNWSPVTSGSE